MPTLLAIEVSPRANFSTSRKLTALFIEKWKDANPGGAVVVRDLIKTNLPFVDLSWIGGAFTPPDQHSPENAAAIKISDDLVAELKVPIGLSSALRCSTFRFPQPSKPTSITSCASERSA